MAQQNTKPSPDSLAYALDTIEHARLSLTVAVDTLNKNQREDLAAALYEAQAALARLNWKELRQAAKMS
jgi:hypothetical protein